MLRLSLLTFITPKILTFYLFEIFLIYRVVSAVLSGIFLGKKIKKSLFLYANRHLVAATTVLFFWSLFVCMLSTAGNNKFPTHDFLLAAKFTLYFVGFSFFLPRRLAENFYLYFDKILYLFFALSLLIFQSLGGGYTLSQRLYMASEFGARFVGLTGSSLTLEGIILDGSTANSVGMFYVLSFAYFWRNEPKLLPLAVSSLGCLLTFSQTAVACLLLYVCISGLLNLRRLAVYRAALVFGMASWVLIVSTDFSVFERLGRLANALWSDGSSLGTVGDRMLQIELLLKRLVQCPSIVFLGDGLVTPEACGTDAIIESFFLYQFATFGLVGAIGGVLHFALFARFLTVEVFQDSGLVMTLWAAANLIAANTYQTDFLMMFLLLLSAGKFYATRKNVPSAI